MRRLANQSRKDTYTSLRDYQTLHDRRGQRFVPLGASPFKLILDLRAPGKADGLFCWGGYVRSQVGTLLTASIVLKGETTVWSFSLDPRWRRIGGLVKNAPQAISTRLTLEWDGSPKPLDFWGLNAGCPAVPPRESGDIDLSLLEQVHLTPETFYLHHDVAIGLDIDADSSERFKMEEGAKIQLKKCSYCGRLLPVDMLRLGALAFHKHNDKRTKHQNECRACKKWRINDSFNPIRTTDQLHESSVITRERKLFLREPAILQEIKSRTGAGLKSKIWNRFGRKCFRCNSPVKLTAFQLDHTRPLAYLWPIDEHATCLCGKCNNEKKEKFPVDFYSPQELVRLSRVTGLPVGDLQKKELNEQELNRILDQLPTFARDWEPRTFMATARKVRELRSDIDLFKVLKSRDRAGYNRLIKELKERPPAIEEA